MQTERVDQFLKDLQELVCGNRDDDEFSAHQAMIGAVEEQINFLLDVKHFLLNQSRKANAGGRLLIWRGMLRRYRGTDEIPPARQPDMPVPEDL